MNKAKINFIINNLLDKYDSNENIVEDDFIIALVQIKNIVEENTPINLLDENSNYRQALLDIKEYIEESSLEVSTREYGRLIVANSDDLLEIVNKALGDDK